MRLLNYIIFLSTLSYLISCITGSISGLPDYKIAFIPIEHEPSMYLMNADGTDRTLIVQEESEITTHYRAPIWDNNNNLYFIASRTWYFDQGFMWRDTLYRIDIKSKRNDMIYGSKSGIYNLIFNGVTYAAFYESGSGSLNILNLETKEKRMISSTSMDSYLNLSWSPDPSKILLYKKEDPNIKIYTLDLTNSYISYLVTVENTRYLHPSPNATKIAYVSSDDLSLSILDIGNLSSEIIVESDKQIGLPTWSFDNINLIYVQYDYSSQMDNMYIVNSISKSVTKLFSAHASFYQHSFFPDAKRFCFSKRVYENQDREDLLSFNLLTNEMFNLTKDQQISNCIYAISSNIIH